MDAENVKQALLALDDTTPEGTVAAAKLMKVRLREIFADEQTYSDNNECLRNTALSAQAYIQISDFIARHERKPAPRQLGPRL